MKKFGRIACLLLAAVLLFNSYMIPRANAIALEAGSIAYVAAEVLIPAMAVGLGLGAVNNAGGWQAFRQLCRSINTSLTAQGMVKNGQIPVIKYGGLNYVAGVTLEAVKNVFFADKYIVRPTYDGMYTNSVTIPIDNTGSTIVASSNSAIYTYFWKWTFYANNGYKYYAYGRAVLSPSTLKVGSYTYANGKYYQYSSSRTNYYTGLPGIDLGERTNAIPPEMQSLVDSWTIADTVETVAEGLVQGVIKPLPQKDIETNYVTWGNTALQVEEFPEPDDGGDNDPDLEPGKFFPILLPEWEYEDTQDPIEFPNQEEIQDPIPVIPDPGPGPTPDPDPGPSPDPDPDPDPDPGPVPSPDLGEDIPDMVFDLRDIFPFCIPFDIYRLLSVLSAEPVAPEFDLALHGYGRDFALHVDLSPFDSIAAIFRSFELMGFIVGLGVATRNRFLRG